MQAVQRQQGFRRLLKVEKVMEASRVCPAAGQMMYAPRLPEGATKRLDSKKTKRSKQLDQTVSCPLSHTSLDVQYFLIFFSFSVKELLFYFFPSTSLPCPV